MAKQLAMSNDTKTYKNYEQIEGWLSITGNTILFVLKYWVGVVTGSIALIADAWHTLTDSFSSIIVIVSARISRKPADDTHPFGHGRADLVSAVIIGVLLAMIGFQFILKSIVALQTQSGVVFGKQAIIVTIISIFVKEGMAQYAFWAGKHSSSSILKADGWHHRTDALSSVIVLIGILLGKFFWWIDGVLGIIVALLIFYAAYEILSEAINRLMGEVPDNKIIQDIKGITGDLNLEVCPHHFQMHRYGQHIELTFHIIFPPEMTIEEAHKQAHELEAAIRNRLNIESTIHMEPSNRPEVQPYLKKQRKL